jgi:ABC-type Zn uptake system ZnuABC Zn-binding protein ZnuA
VLGCTAAPTPSPSGAPSLDVVATTTVFADLVAQVGGDRVSVSSLVPRGAEVHTFDPTPSMARQAAGADLLVMNGLGLDDWLRRLAADAGSDARVLVLGEDLPGASYVASGDAAAPNPHLWLDVTYAEGYVVRIRDALKAADPAGDTTYDAHAEAYVARLRELDTWARSTMAAIPADARRVIAFHDALPYFARAYGLEIVGVVLPAPGQDPSAGYVAQLVDEIRRLKVRAILSEVQFSPALAQTIADETGARLISDIYDDTLGDPPVDTYEGLIRWDVERIVAAMRGAADTMSAWV